ncbi:MAG: DUF502 domain-containing protein [Chitinophagales bacterium]
MKQFGKYLLQGLLLFAPLIITVYIFLATFLWLDNMANDLIETLFGFRFMGLGFVVMILLLAALGWLGSTLLFRPFYNFMEQVFQSTPLLKIIYTSLKDLFSAFVGKEKKFEKVVLVKFAGSEQLQRMGFLTQSDLEGIGLKAKVAVYFPHSYNFSGNLYIVDKSCVTLIDIDVSTAMKFMVSGGVAKI